MIKRGTSLKPLNSFGVQAKAALFAVAKNKKDLAVLLKDKRFTFAWILGGGSNTIFCNSPQQPIIHVAISGIKIMEESAEDVVVQVGAGMNWHDLVLWSLDQGFGGLENLSLIPGNVGAAPIQNIGAYGVELQDVFEKCSVMFRNNQTVETFDQKACRFGYRDSIFKNALKNKVVITDLSLRLRKKNFQLHTSYGALQQELASNKITNPSPKDISQAVINIRSTKLPDPKHLGNAGSFFKNPIVSDKQLKNLKKSFSEIPYYPQSKRYHKIPAAWLIEKAGLKGARDGDVGIHKNHALVLVNYGNASGHDIKAFSIMVQQKVQRYFGIQLDPEVNFCC